MILAQKHNKTTLFVIRNNVLLSFKITGCTVEGEPNLGEIKAKI